MPEHIAAAYESILRRSLATAGAAGELDIGRAERVSADLAAWLAGDPTRPDTLMQALASLRPLPSVLPASDPERAVDAPDDQQLTAWAAAALASSPRGFALLDATGIIVHANTALGVLLGTDTPVGARLASFFPDDEARVRELAGSRGPRQLRRLRLVPAAGPGRIVTAEFGQIAAAARFCSVALMTDVTPFVRGDLAAYEAADFGIVRTDASERSIITYVNKAGAKLLGRAPDELVGMATTELFPSPADQATLTEQRRLRSTGRATPYKLHLPQANGYSRPLMVAAFPEYSTADGERIGTLAVVQSLEKPATRDRLHELMERHADDPHALLTAALTTIDQLIPHSFAVFTIYEDEWAWPAHLEPRPPKEWSTRWFRLPPSIVAWMTEAPDQSSGGTLVDDLASFFDPFDDAEELADDEVTRNLVKEGHRCVMSLPFRAADRRWLASLSLFRRLGEPFNRADVDTAKEVGLVSLVQSALGAFRRREERFSDTLRVRVRAAPDKTRACHQLTELLCPYFRWQHVSVFACEYRARRFELVAQQRYKGDGFLLEDDFTQPFDVGVMGLAFAEQRTVVVNDLRDGSCEARAFVRQHARTQATLVLPVRLAGRVLLLINAEDSRRNSFSPHTVHTLERYVDALEKSLGALLDRQVVQTMGRESASGLLLVDRFGTIWRANDKARTMLGLRAAVPDPDQLEAILPNELERTAALSPMPVDGLRVALKRHDGTLRHALMYTADLEGDAAPTASAGNNTAARATTEFRLIYLTDLQRLRWQHDVAAVKGAVVALARQIHLPLSGAHEALNELISALERGDAVGARDQITPLRDTLKQLDLTNRRLFRASDDQAMHEEGRARLDFGELVVDVVGRCVDERTKAVDDVKIPVEPVYVSGARARLAFVLESILSYVLSRRALERPARLRLKTRGDHVEVSVDAALGEQPFAQLDSITRVQRQAGQLLTLNETTIREILEREHGGAYTHTVGANGRSRFKIRLPAARVAGE